MTGRAYEAMQLVEAMDADELLWLAHELQELVRRRPE